MDYSYTDEPTIVPLMESGIMPGPGVMLDDRFVFGFGGAVVEDVPAFGAAEYRMTRPIDETGKPTGDVYVEIVRPDGTIAGDTRRGDEVAVVLSTRTLTGRDGTIAYDTGCVGFRVRRRVLYGDVVVAAIES